MMDMLTKALQSASPMDAVIDYLAGIVISASCQTSPDVFAVLKSLASLSHFQPSALVGTHTTLQEFAAMIPDFEESFSFVDAFAASLRPPPSPQRTCCKEHAAQRTTAAVPAMVGTASGAVRVAKRPAATVVWL